MIPSILYSCNLSSDGHNIIVVLDKLNNVEVGLSSSFFINFVQSCFCFVGSRVAHYSGENLISFGLLIYTINHFSVFMSELIYVQDFFSVLDCVACSNVALLHLVQIDFITGFLNDFFYLNDLSSFSSGYVYLCKDGSYLLLGKIELITIKINGNEYKSLILSSIDGTVMGRKIFFN